MLRLSTLVKTPFALVFGCQQMQNDCTKLSETTLFQCYCGKKEANLFPEFMPESFQVSLT